MKTTVNCFTVHKLFYHVVVVVLIIEGVFLFVNVILFVLISALQGRSFVNVMLNDLLT